MSGLAFSSANPEPCEWCGWDFPATDAEGSDRQNCMNRDHIEAGCDNCGTCLHASHRSQ